MTKFVLHIETRRRTLREWCFDVWWRCYWPIWSRRNPGPWRRDGWLTKK